MREPLLRIGILSAVFSLAAVSCNFGSAPQEVDTIGTQVAVQQAVAASLTAAAQAQITPTPLATQTPSLPVAGDTAAPPTSIPLLSPTFAPLPTDTQPAPPTQPPPTPEPTLEADGIVLVPGGGDGLQGQVRLPGLPSTDPENLVFTDRIIFYMEVFDSDVGAQDGDGIDHVDFTITDNDSGETVHTHTEDTAKYCVFGGGEPDCNVFVFEDNNHLWPETNLPVHDGSYNVNVHVVADDLDKEGDWNFDFEIQQP